MPAFEAFATAAWLENRFRREVQWKEIYRAAHPDVFAGLEDAVPGLTKGVPAMVRELSRVRDRAEQAAPVMRTIIEELDPRLAALMEVPTEPSPVHVLMVGAFTTNSAVGQLGDEVAVFHCLEWFQTAEGARALVAHEGAHAWHRLALHEAGQKLPPDDDLPWTIFSEGLATQVSRVAAPGLPEVDYFWYGHPEMEDWVPWCGAHASELQEQVRGALDVPEAVDTFFGAGLIDGKWRVGYHLADRLVAELGRSLPELVALPVDSARQLVLEALTTTG
jgi:hypothetical protein